MAHDETEFPATDRRAFLQAGAVAAASVAAMSPGLRAAQDPAAPAKAPAVPTRRLGKTGVDITILDQGAVREGYDRIIRLAYARGVRVFDAAKAYGVGNEPVLKKWFEASPEVRKEIFLVTKDGPKNPGQIPAMVDERLASLGTDHIDLFFVHGLGDEHSLDDAIKMVTSPEFKAAAEAVKKSGKVKFIGFSTHHRDRAQIIEAAAKAGMVDAIMLMYTPWLEKDDPLNKALDLCHEKGVGLITMKQVAGNFPAKPKFNVLEEVVRRAPWLKEKGFSPFQGLLHAIWTDERISSSCVSMKNSEQLRENIDAAVRYAPLKAAELEQLKHATLAANPTLCGGCDGRCSVAAGTEAELGNLTRFLTYHEYHGHRSEARNEYAALSPAARDWSGADLAAAREACPSKLDFAALLPEVDRHLA